MNKYDDLNWLQKERKKCKCFIWFMIGTMIFVILLFTLMTLSADKKIVGILVIIPILSILQSINEEASRMKAFDKQINYLKSKQLMKETMNEILNDYDSKNGGK